ncbi:LLM class flavin-dependent oxidoreductase [Membranicola marinus]|uniref:Luciferase-like monooxygenase n=1 Tax=Membranihabitans marinus TaxID=1227546 RepID=A0A953LA52_9BACT|nr:LLM class flavin-dependent oxidoreductase [Membranihabitans marinus]MBY5958333.1 LLM class flavin-dependent oxidoreductase [Membranihabitans marinus]
MNKSFSKIPISILDLAVITEGGSPALSFKNSVDLAQNAENQEYHRFWVAEHHNMDSVASSATTVLMGFIAANTSSIRVGSGGIMLPNHAPLVVAEQIGTLESIYPGRIDLGLGRAPGTDPLTAYALRRDEQSAHRFPQSVREIQTYLSADNKGAKVRAIPGEGLDIPIWILGSSTDSARLAAAMGLPYAFASHFAPRQLHEAASIYRADFQPSAQLSEPFFMPCVNVILSDSQEEAELLATSAQKLFIGIITGNRSPLQPPDPDFEMPLAAQAAMDQMTKYSFIGDSDTVEKQINDFVDATAADELMVVSHIFDHEARLHSYSLLKEMQ